MAKLPKSPTDEVVHIVYVPATMREPDGTEVVGRLRHTFRDGIPIGSVIFVPDPPAEPPVEDLLEQRPVGPYRWTAFHAHSYKRYFVLLVLIEPPYGSWWLGTADTLEQAEHIFFTWLNTDPQPLLGPSSSIGAYGV